MSTAPSAVAVTAERLRAWFNDEGCLQAIVDGTLREEIKADRPAPAHIGPPGTRSQLVRYYDDVRLRAEIHRYLLPDGSLGASGVPDPKGLHRNGRWYYTVT
jgi:hypothetical protein